MSGDADANTRSVAGSPGAARSPLEAPPHAGPELAAGTRVEKFTIAGRIGAGGMGVVYEAVDNVLGRRVALKLMAVGAGHADGLLAEARAAGALTHANVVSVYEAGASEHGVFIAMELVEGQDARAWCKGKRAAEVLRVFREAGEGLCAAHAAGIVHNDVKPDNILVDEERARIADFGIHLGTPRYLPPDGRGGTARDTHAFCVSLREMLGGGAPRWMLRASARGLATSRPQATLREVLDALRFDPAARRRRAVALAAAAVVAGGAAVAGALLGGEAPRCRGLDAPMRDVWSPARRAAIEAAFRAAGRPYGEATLARVAEALDRRAQGWVAARVEACRATERGEQSEALLDKRMHCLDDRLSEVQAAVDVLTAANPEIVDQALDLTETLGRGDLCDDLAALDAAIPLPADPAARARIASLKREVAAVEAMVQTGDAKKAIPIAEALLPRVRAVSYAPLLADILLPRAMAASAVRDDATELALLRELTTVAAAAHRDGQVVAAWQCLIYALAVHAGRLDEAVTLIPAAESALARIPGDHLARFRLSDTLASVERKRGDNARADALFKEAIVEAEAAGGRDGPMVAMSLNNYSGVLIESGRMVEARAMLERALAIRRGYYGEGHRYTVATKRSLARLLSYEGRYAEARRAYEEVLDGYVRLYGPDHPKVGEITVALGLLDTKEGQPARALERFEQVRAAQRRRHVADDDVEVAMVELSAGVALEQLARHDESLARCRAARAAYEAKKMKVLKSAEAAECVGEALLRLGRRDEAVATLELALEEHRQLGTAASGYAGVTALLKEARR